VSLVSRGTWMLSSLGKVVSELLNENLGEEFKK
jgi:hypothetical protein